MDSDCHKLSQILNKTLHTHNVINHSISCETQTINLNNTPFPSSRDCTVLSLGVSRGLDRLRPNSGEGRVSADKYRQPAVQTTSRALALSPPPSLVPTMVARTRATRPPPVVHPPRRQNPAPTLRSVPGRQRPSHAPRSSSDSFRSGSPSSFTSSRPPSTLSCTSVAPTSPLPLSALSGDANRWKRQQPTRPPATGATPAAVTRKRAVRMASRIPCRSQAELGRMGGERCVS